MLFYTGLSYQIGEVHDSAATMDWMNRSRAGITITRRPRLAWQACSSSLISTVSISSIPGVGSVERRSLRVLDGAVVVLCGSSGVQPQTETVAPGEQCEGLHGFVNKWTALGQTLKWLSSSFVIVWANAVPIQMTIGAEEDFKGVIDPIDKGHHLERMVWV